jgi:hypothetical protein
MDTKTIVISGKHNRYHMKKIIHEVERSPESLSTVVELDPQFYTHRIQVDLMKYIRDDTESIDFPLQYAGARVVFVRNINQKLNGYLSQDRIKGRLDESVAHITRDEAIKKLVECGQTCYYCSKEVFVLYDVVRDAAQWTLDRINNSVRHSNDNVVVACLACNLEKRSRGKTAFRLTKQMVLHKTEYDSDSDSGSGSGSEDDPFAQTSTSSIEYSQDA